MASTTSFFGSSNNAGTRTNNSTRFGRTIANQLNNTSPDGSSGGSVRQNGNVVVTSRELGRVFDAIKELSDITKRQNGKIEKMAGKLEIFEEDISALRRQMDEFKDMMDTSNSNNIEKRAPHYGPIPKEVKVKL